MSNCLLNGNAAILGGGLASYESSSTLTNCVLWNNTASSSGGGLWLGSSDPVVTNSILWSNTPQQVHVYSGDPLITYSDVQGGWTGRATWTPTRCGLIRQVAIST